MTIGGRTLRVSWGAATLLVALLGGCSRPPRVAADSTPAKTADPIVASREADDVARFIAGMPGTPDGPFADLENFTAWKEHRRLMDQAWRHAEAELIGGLHE